MTQEPAATAALRLPQAETGKPGSALSLALWMLRAAVLLHAIGKFACVFSMRPTQFGILLFIEIFDQRLQVPDPHASAVLVEKITVTLYLLAGLVVFIRPWAPLLLMMAGYALLEAVSGTLTAGYRFSEWTIHAHALRFSVPLILAVLVAFPKSAFMGRWRVPSAVLLLRVAIATVFIMHGFQALWADPQFIDLIIGTSRRLIGYRITEAATVTSLQVIGVVDLAVALAIMIYPVPPLVPRRFWANPCAVCPIRRTITPLLLGWASLWGFVTAASRMTSLGLIGGLPQYPELLDRVSHGLAPLVLWCLYSATGNSSPPCSAQVVSPEDASGMVVQRR